MLLKGVLVSLCVAFAAAIELTFELPDNANQCFYEEIRAGVDVLFEFQVVTGGQYDVDLVIRDPTGKELYKQPKKQYDSHNFRAEHPGVYEACFSNEFSTFSHKIVYMDWQVGGQGHTGGPNDGGSHVGLTAMDSSAVTIGDKLKVVDDFQTHHRLREAQGRKRAEQLNERVMLWSIGQTAVVLLVGISQVFLLRSFFSDKRPARGGF